jgi:hypothetical protein
MGQRVLSEQEYNQIREQVLSSMPPNLDEATFNKHITGAMQMAIAEAETRPAQAEGSALGRFGSNLGAMLNPVEMAKGAYQAVRHPIDTGTAVVGAMGDQWSQGIEQAKQGRVLESLGHMAAGSIPMVGPAAAHVGEQIAQGDVAGGLGATAGLLAPFGVKPAVQTARTLTPKGLRATIAEAMEAKAGRNYTETMAPTVGRNKTRFGTMANEVGPELAKNPDMAAWSREGLHGKVKQGLDSATQQLDEAADANLATASIETKPIVEGLKAARQKLVAEAIDADFPDRQVTSRTSQILDADGRPAVVSEAKAKAIGKDVEPSPNAARIAALDKVIAEVEQLGPIARYDSLRRIRQAWDGPAKQTYIPSPTADLLTLKGGSRGAADATGVLRENLGKASPKMAQANEAYHLHKTANEVLDATAEVERTRPKVGRAIMARLTGSVVGGQSAGTTGALAGYVLGPVVDAAAAGAPTIRLQTAQLMTRLAKVIRTGDVEQAGTIITKLERLAKSGQSAVNVAQQLSPASAAGPRDRPAETAGR